MAAQDTVQLSPGDTLFSVGYGARYIPNLPAIDPNPISKRPGERQPVVVPGTVLSVEGRRVEFLTSIGGYGALPDTQVRHGDSGGPILSNNGAYLGDVVALFPEDMSGADIEKRYDVDIPDGEEGRYFNVAVAQIVDTHTLTELAAAVEPCTTAAPIQKTVPAGSDPVTWPGPE